MQKCEEVAKTLDDAEEFDRLRMEEKACVVLPIVPVTARKSSAYHNLCQAIYSMLNISGNNRRTCRTLI